MKKIPSIHQPIQKSDGSMEYVWYLFLQWVSENTGKIDLSDYFTKEETEALLAPKVDADDLANVAFTGDYDDLTNKPTIPTVGDGTITVKQGGVTKGTFTVNQSGNTEINIDEGGGTGDGVTITENSDEELQAVAVIDQNTGIVKTWTGTAAEYDAIVTKDPDTEYIITDDIGGPATAIGQITEALNDKVDKGHEVIEFQAPTAANDYTWYRKYADGWVEQGGLDGGSTQGGTSDRRVNIPIIMSDANYYVNCQKVSGWDGAALSIQVGTRDTTGFNWSITYSSSAQNRNICWEVKGMAA